MKQVTKTISALLLLALSGCAASGPVYDKTLLQIKGDGTIGQIFFYRPSAGIMGAMAYAQVYVDGIKRCSLPPNSYFVYQGGGGVAGIRIEQALTPGSTRFSLEIERGNSHFVRIYSNSSFIAGAALAGAPGALISGGGPYIAYRVQENEANNEMVGFRMASCDQ